MPHKSLLVMLTLLLSLGLLTGAEKAQDQPQAKIGEPAPDFTLENYDGKTHSLADYEGKIVVLEWFNPQCPYVKNHYEKERTMLDMAQKYGQREGEPEVVWLAINTSYDADHAYNQKTAEQWEIDYPILNDQDGTVGRMYGARTTPEMVIINPEGILVYQGAIDDNPTVNAPSDDSVNYVAKALDEVLAGEEVSIPQTKPYGCTVKYKRD